ncbi:hypothetical protein Zm00014a_022906 [Zea mays]|uniref:DUF7722 domain-containing protein n=1 Tax=Zea mays TaxID=4577 RepID=A0A3L6DLK4_MAIZE|nr:hypothetical protein Zm00014a_022906 [Zea mays]
METMAARYGGGEIRDLQSKQEAGGGCGSYFQMPLHYPRHSREDYEAMPEWQLDRLLSEYGLPVAGTVHQKRTFAMGTFLWGAGGNIH